MAITTSPMRILYQGNGASTVFPFPYLFEENSDLVVSTYASATRTVVTLNPATDYTVTGAGVTAGGTVTLVVAPITGVTLVIERIMPLTQESSYNPNAGIDTVQLDTDFDRLVMISQQLQDGLSRCLQGSIFDPLGTSLVLPPAAARAGFQLGFDNAGNVSLFTNIGQNRGVWVTNTMYNFGDIVTDGVSGNVYTVPVAYTSGASVAADVTAGNLLIVFDIVGATNAAVAAAGALLSPFDTNQFASSSSAANTYASTLSPAPTAYVRGMEVAIDFVNANTGAATINLNGLGAKTIQCNGNALAAGQIAAGMTASLRYDGTNFQLINPNITAVPFTHLQQLSGSGNFTIPAGITCIKVTAIGGGGGGGGGTASNTAGGGGGGGAILAWVNNLVPGSVIAYVVGAGGTAGTSGGGTGGTGGSSTFALPTGTITAVGGSGGVNGSGGASGAGGAGGTGGGGGSQVAYTGQPGGASNGASTTFAPGNGGNSPLGYGYGGLARPPTSSSSIAGTNGNLYGGGGSGANGAATGGAGAAGHILIEF